jgi:hypothetical protein
MSVTFTVMVGGVVPAGAVPAAIACWTAAAACAFAVGGRGQHLGVVAEHDRAVDVALPDGVHCGVPAVVGCERECSVARGGQLLFDHGHLGGRPGDADRQVFDR